MNLWNEGQELLNGVHCKAEYNEQIVDRNQGNPFIEAIPNRLDIESFYDKLYSVPMFKTENLELGIEDRLELVQQIKPSFWLPLPNHYDKYRSLYNMIKIGYQSRNPITVMYNRQFAMGWDKILVTGLDETGANIAGNIQTAQSSTEIGLSGMGKSKVYERILKLLFPQVIHHSEYKGRKLLTTQVVWLKIECPSGKSLGALCKNFYAAVDDLLGSSFYEKHGAKGGTIDDLAKRMVRVAAQINLGVLIIDEIQNVQKAHSGGDERIINFITELVNTIGIPVIVIGTFKAMYLYKKSLAVSRRGIPDMYNENVTTLMLDDSWEWNEFLKNLWDLQYTVKYTPLTEDLKKVMYYQTLGIPDIAVKLFMHVQAKAILNGEEITVPLLNDVASKSLKLLQPIFERIRRGSSISLLDELDDVNLEWGSFNDYFKQASHCVNLYGKAAMDHSRVIQQKNKDSILTELVQFALNIVSSNELAESLALTVFQGSEGMGNKTNMFAHLAQLALNNTLPISVTENVNHESNLPKLAKPKKVKPLLEQCDIRFIVNEGLKKGLSSEEALFEAGLVKEYDEMSEII
ncbi:AAA family ATPase [Fictibacillus norfolkensis]|uniref:ATP-binding protein n=1 Tax=Fictibacillus norfolkensis TaxID=2762233 RepID=A0ABR8SR12_9BACL|nr:ATP-binding protein [Fictibacillus norfolkensis]MBD7965946.1 ATP-binding protein [Fictibacillus norfolkensis]